ncbi:hypothetical protein [Gloeocapsa sp. PCC 73106]|uniref:hypothetical protein n=1 Tax=Gloeocapsa sp. PCC 73106 TaxID=102232 RepID=UPI0002ACACD8|nr:hypothetical protein [Gloeocapsa sp. PCC 73106]ELR99318.1 FG-GAP repeat protein [Gloeocapsa sp. PCC 73106]
MAIASPFELADINGTNGTVIQGVSGSSNFALDVSGVGDINRDGRDDFVLTEKSLSRAYVFFGNANGIPNNLNVNALGANGYRIIGPSGSNSATGGLFFWSNSTTSTQLATLSPGLGLTSSNFVVTA